MSAGSAPRRVLVTGGATGIGAATVRALADNGYAVDFTYRASAEAAQALLGALREAHPDRAFEAHAVDLADKAALNVRLDSFGPMAVAVTDWRGAGMCEADWGWGGDGGADGRPAAARQLADTVVENMVMIYPRRDADVDAGAGLEVVLPFETEFVDVYWGMRS